MDGFMIIFMVTINVLDCNGISLRVQLEDLLGIDRDGQEYSDEYQLAGGGQGSLSESDASESRQDADVNEFYGGSQENTDKHSDYSNEYQNSQEVDLPEYKEYDKPIGRVLKVREFTDDHGTVWKKHKHERMPSLQSRTRFSQQSLSPLTHKVQANGVEIQFVDLHRGQRQDMYGRPLGPKMSNVNPGMNVQVGQVRNGETEKHHVLQLRNELHRITNEFSRSIAELRQSIAATNAKNDALNARLDSIVIKKVKSSPYSMPVINAREDRIFDPREDTPQPRKIEHTDRLKSCDKKSLFQSKATPQGVEPKTRYLKIRLPRSICSTAPARLRIALVGNMCG